VKSCYQRVHGQAVNYYFATELPAIVVLTDRDELDFFCPPKVLVELTPKFETTLWSCIAQSQEITQVLWGPQSKKILLKQLYWLVVYLVSVLESQVRSESGKSGRNGEADHPAALPAVTAEAMEVLSEDGAEPADSSTSSPRSPSWQGSASAAPRTSRCGRRHLAATSRASRPPARRRGSPAATVSRSRTSRARSGPARPWTAG
jgi:hypothetical protein